MKLEVITVAVGVLLVGALLAGLLDIVEAFLIAGTAALITWKVNRFVRGSKRNRRG